MLIKNVKGVLSVGADEKSVTIEDAVIVKKDAFYHHEIDELIFDTVNFIEKGFNTVGKENNVKFKRAILRNVGLFFYEDFEKFDEIIIENCSVIIYRSEEPYNMDIINMLCDKCKMVVPYMDDIQGNKFFISTPNGHCLQHDVDKHQLDEAINGNIVDAIYRNTMTCCHLYHHNISEAFIENGSRLPRVELYDHTKEINIKNINTIMFNTLDIPNVKSVFITDVDNLMLNYRSDASVEYLHLYLLENVKRIYLYPDKTYDNIHRNKDVDDECDIITMPFGWVSGYKLKQLDEWIQSVTKPKSKL